MSNDFEMQVTNAVKNLIAEIEDLKQMVLGQSLVIDYLKLQTGFDPEQFTPWAEAQWNKMREQFLALQEQYKTDVLKEAVGPTPFSLEE